MRKNEKAQDNKIISAARLLYVEDKEIWQHALKDRLEEMGYKVDLADSCRHAQYFLERCTYELVLVDLQMKDFNDVMNDEAGIDLADYIHSRWSEIPIIIITSYPNYKTARLVGTRGIKNYFTKDTEELDKLGETIAGSIMKNQQLKISLSGELRELPQDDIEILQKLFLDSIEIRVGFFSERGRGTRICKVDSRDANGVWIIPLLVKFGWRDSIEQELKAFNRYVKLQILSQRYPQIVRTAFAGRRGGISYSFIGGPGNFETLTFRQFYISRTASDIEDLISKIFRDLFKIWHENKGNKQPMNLFDEYENLLFKASKVEGIIKTYLKDLGKKSSVTLFNQMGEIPNPLKRFMNMPKKYETRAYLCTVHGDLNSENVLVDQSGSPWLIDFEWTDVCHILKDHSEFEVSLKYDVLCDLAPEELVKIEDTVLQADSLSAPLKMIGASKEIQKALRVIKTVREYADSAIAPGGDIVEYWIALLYHTVNLLRFENKVFSMEKKKVMLYAVHLILENIEKRIPSM